MNNNQNLIQRNIDRLNKFKQFEDNWNGYNAPKVDPKYIDYCISIIELIDNERQPEVFMNNGSIIQLEWESKDYNNYYIELTILGNDRFDIYIQKEDKDILDIDNAYINKQYIFEFIKSMIREVIIMNMRDDYIEAKKTINKAYGEEARKQLKEFTSEHTIGKIEDIIHYDPPRKYKSIEQELEELEIMKKHYIESLNKKRELTVYLYELTGPIKRISNSLEEFNEQVEDKSIIGVQTYCLAGLNFSYLENFESLTVVGKYLSVIFRIKDREKLDTFTNAIIDYKVYGNDIIDYTVLYNKELRFSHNLYKLIMNGYFNLNKDPKYSLGAYIEYARNNRSNIKKKIITITDIDTGEYENNKEKINSDLVKQLYEYDEGNETTVFIKTKSLDIINYNFIKYGNVVFIDLNNSDVSKTVNLNIHLKHTLPAIRVRVSNKGKSQYAKRCIIDEIENIDPNILKEFAIDLFRFYCKDYL